MNTAISQLGGAGTSTAALGFGGAPPTAVTAATEEWSDPGTIIKTITTS